MQSFPTVCNDFLQQIPLSAHFYRCISGIPLAIVKGQEDSKMETETNDTNRMNLDSVTVEKMNSDTIASVGAGAVALVPVRWLEHLLSREQPPSSTTPIKAVRKAKEKTPIEEEPEDLSARGRKPGVFMLTSTGRAKEDVRGRERLKALFLYLKEHPQGAEAKQIATELRMPLSTVHFNLNQLMRRHAVTSK